MALALIWQDRKEENGSPGTMATAGFPHSGRQPIDVMQNLWWIRSFGPFPPSAFSKSLRRYHAAAAADWDAPVVCEGLPSPDNPKFLSEEGVERHAVRTWTEKKTRRCCSSATIMVSQVSSCNASLRRLVAPHSETIGASSDRPIPSLFFLSACAVAILPHDALVYLRLSVVVQLAGHG